MNRKPSFVLQCILLLSTAVFLSTIFTSTVCARPAGEEIGSCEGTMQFTSGGQSRFVLKVYYREDADEDQVKLYFMLPGKTGLLPVRDMDFEDDVMTISAGSGKKQVFAGIISRTPLKFKGSLKGFEGALTLDLNQFSDK